MGDQLTTFAVEHMANAYTIKKKSRYFGLTS